MSSDVDTLLDALAAQARSRRPLAADAVADLLAEVAGGRAAGEGAAATLVEHHLGVALDAAIAHRDRGVEVTDLYQEASLALLGAVRSYAAAGGGPRGLPGGLRAAVDGHLEGVIAEAAARRADEEAILRDVRLFEFAEVELRKRERREPTADELATLLGWEPSRVEAVGEMLAEARRRHDEDLLPYLDDA